ALPIGFVSLSNSNKSVSLISKSLNINESTTDASINLNDALPVTDNSITGFGDYIVSYEDNNVSPVNAILPGSSTISSKSGGATVGMTANKQTITLTTYAGLLLWSHKLNENQLLKNYYSTVRTVDDISTYKVINFAYLESKNILFVLFGQEISETNTLSNLAVFGLDINSGAIVVPKDATLNNNQVIAKARDNSAFIFFNTADQLIVTSGGTNTNIQSSTKIMSFDSNTGFANSKGNDEETNNFGAISGVVGSGDYLLGFLPSTIENVNYSIWLYSASKQTGSVYGGPRNPQISYKTTNESTASIKGINMSGGTITTSLNYYIYPVDNSFISNIGASNSQRFNVINTVGSTAYRGYLNNTNQMPNFNDITKRFFVTSSTTTNSNTVENVGVLLDSFDKMFSSFATAVVNINSDTNITFGTPKLYMNYLDKQPMTGPTDLSYDATKKTGLEDGVAVTNWTFNSVGYDKKSEFVYFSLSGEETNATDQTIISGKYLTNTRYIDLKVTTSDANRVSSDAYVETNPYTLSVVNFDTYTNSGNLYLTKQVIDGSDGEWLTSTIEKLNDDAEDFKPTQDPKINFSSLRNFEMEIENSQILNEVMPSFMNNNLNSLDKFLNDKGISDIVTFKKATGNDETGEIRLETEITYANDFGDETKENNGNVSYLSYIQVTGFSRNDFSLIFKTEEAIADIKAKYSAEEIVKSENKGWVIQELLEKILIKDKNITITESMKNIITLNNPSSDSLRIDIDIPIKTSPTDTNGILPVGFPEDQAKKTITYSGFTGTETPPFVSLPTNPDDPNNSNNPNNTNLGNGSSAGEIAGIVIACLAIAAILIAIAVLIRIKIKNSS
ncbi:MAG: hypothetical protein K2O21_03250, partial [Malacoplasma sp.]|nr:hypothetical protein [Malacoplasma sp.]